MSWSIFGPDVSEKVWFGVLLGLLVVSVFVMGIILIAT